MRSELEYIIGNKPKEGGEYLTVRESKLNGHRYITFNSYDKTHEMWLMECADGSETIAYCNIKDIKLS